MPGATTLFAKVGGVWFLTRTWSGYISVCLLEISLPSGYTRSLVKRTSALVTTVVLEIPSDRPDLTDRFNLHMLQVLAAWYVQ